MTWNDLSELTDHFKLKGVNINKILEKLDSLDKVTLAAVVWFINKSKYEEGKIL